MAGWISAHPLLTLLAAAAIAAFVWLMLIRRRLGMKWYAAAILAVLHLLVGVLCVKLFAVAEAGFDFSKFKSQSLFGAVFLLPVFYFLGAKLTKRSPADVFDCFTVPMVFTLFCARINCLIIGCCMGRMMAGGSFRAPTREAELVFYAVFLAFMIPGVLKGRGRGTAYPLFLIAYGAFRFICEFFRESAAFSGAFHLSHVWALIAFLLGLSIYIEQRSKKNVLHH